MNSPSTIKGKEYFHQRIIRRHRLYPIKMGLQGRKTEKKGNCPIAKVHREEEQQRSGYPEQKRPNSPNRMDTKHSGMSSSIEKMGTSPNRCLYNNVNQETGLVFCSAIESLCARGRCITTVTGSSGPVFVSPIYHNRESD